MDGTVYLWQMRNPLHSNLYIIEKLLEYSLTKSGIGISIENLIPNYSKGEQGVRKVESKEKDDLNLKNILNKKGERINTTTFHVQSLQFRFNKIIAGTRSGDIYFLQLPAASEIKSTATNSIDLTSLVYTCHDNENPKEVDFDANCKRIISITDMGLLNIWNFETLEQIGRINFNAPTTAMIMLKSYLYAIIAFEKLIIVLDLENMKEVKDFRKNLDLVSSDVKINFNETILAVAMAPNYEVNTIIKIFNIDYKEERFKEMHVINNISSSIEYMDFSNDSVYLMYMDNINRMCVFDLKNQTKDENDNIGYDAEWIGEGLKISEKRRGLDDYYTEENKVTWLVRAGKSSLIACDQIGTVRLIS